MKIAFFGNPDFAADSLEYLVSNDIQISLAVTNPDKKQGRGQRLHSSPVKQTCLKNDIEYYETDKLDANLEKKLIALNLDLFIVVAYRLLPNRILDIPTHGSINLHASLLPEYRGASPIQYTLLNGNKFAGVTTFLLNSQIDGGDIVLQEKIEIDDRIVFKDLYARLSSIGARVLLDSVKLIYKNKKYQFKPQNSNHATKAPKIKKSQLLINWNNPSLKIHNLIRALSYLGVYTHYRSKRVKLFDSYWSDNNHGLKIGEFRIINEKLHVGTKKGSLIISSIQVEGKKRISVKDFYNTIDSGNNIFG